MFASKFRSDRLDQLCRMEPKPQARGKYSENNSNECHIEFRHNLIRQQNAQKLE